MLLRLLVLVSVHTVSATSRVLAGVDPRSINLYSFPQPPGLHDVSVLEVYTLGDYASQGSFLAEAYDIKTQAQVLSTQEEQDFWFVEDRRAWADTDPDVLRHFLQEYPEYAHASYHSFILGELENQDPVFSHRLDEFCVQNYPNTSDTIPVNPDDQPFTAEVWVDENGSIVPDSEVTFTHAVNSDDGTTASPRLRWNTTSLASSDGELEVDLAGVRDWVKDSVRQIRKTLPEWGTGWINEVADERYEEFLMWALGGGEGLRELARGITKRDGRTVKKILLNQIPAQTIKVQSPLYPWMQP